MSTLRKGKVNGNICDVITPEEFSQNPNLYNNNFTAIQKEDYLYPIRNNNLGPGYYAKNEVIGFYIDQPEEKAEEFSSKNVIDFQSSNIKELIEKSATLKNMEREILCNPDNIFIPRIGEHDSPEMKILKEAVIAKTIDIDKYEQRFGPNYNNDKRLFNKDTITLSKFKTMANALDMKITLTIEDKSPDVPNPIGRVISAELTGGESDEE